MSVIHGLYNDKPLKAICGQCHSYIGYEEDDVNYINGKSYIYCSFCGNKIGVGNKI